MVEVKLKEVDQSVPYAPLCDTEPERTPHEAAMLSRHGEVWKRAMLTGLEGLQRSKAFAMAEKASGRKAIGAKWVLKWIEHLQTKSMHGSSNTVEIKLLFSRCLRLDFFP